MNKSHMLSQEKFVAKLCQSAPMLVAIATEKNFSKAAAKLGVHQSAISHRLNLLEEVLELTLFERTTRQVELTEHGRIICETAQAVVKQCENAIQMLDAFQTQDGINLSVSSSLAMKWMLPNLAAAREQGLEVSLDVNDNPVDFQNGQINAAIRFGNGPYPGLHSHF